MRNNPLETETGSRFVRVHQLNHGYTKDVDQVKLELLSNTWFDLSLQSGTLVVGQKLVGTNGSCIINELEWVSGTDWKVKVSELTGYFGDGEQFNGQVYYEDYNDMSIMSAMGIKPTQLVHSVAVGNFPTGIDNTFNGIPLNDLSTPLHYIQEVDSNDSYVIQVDTPATATGFVGGEGVKAVPNVKVDLLQIQSAYVDYEGDIQWSVEGITHTGVGGNGTNYQPVAEFNVLPFENIRLEQPMKIPNSRNAELNLGAGVAPLKVKCKMKSNNSKLSPVLKSGTSTLIAVSNRVENNSCANFSIEPNAGSWTDTDCEGEFATSTARWRTESDPTQGSEIAKYVCQQVTLKNPATNIIVYLDVLKFLFNDVQIWYRTVPSDIEEDISTREWVKAEFDQDVVSETNTDFKETTTTIEAHRQPLACTIDLCSHRWQTLYNLSQAKQREQAKSHRCQDRGSTFGPNQ